MEIGAPVVSYGKKNENIPNGFSDNVVQHCSFGHGNLEEGFRGADKVIKRTFKTPSVHQGYIEPHACLASMSNDGKAELWCCTQGHFNVRSICSNIFKMDNSQLKVTASEIGGGFGGKTTVFIEPIALALSQKSGHPVKIVMSREEVFKATGPTVSSLVDVEIGMKKSGKITAAKAIIRYEGGAFPNETYELGAQSAFASYDLDAVKTEAFNVLTNRPTQAAYRAPGAPQSIYAVESVIDELCQHFNLDPLYVRILNAAKKGTKSSYGPTFDDIGLKATLEAAKDHPHYNATLKENQGRGISCGFWFNFGGNTCVSLNINFDGTVGVVEGNPDIGGSRSSISQMAAEELGISLDKVKTVIADTNSLGHNDVTDGSRVTFSVGLATIKAAKAAKKELCKRAAKLWGIDEDAVIWKEGYAHPAGANAGNQEPLSLEDIANERHTQEGYSKADNQYLHLSVIDGRSVNITVESEYYDIMGISQFWNNHTSAITIAAHETTDLFKWSKRFVDQDNLVFTWLVEPRAVDSADWLPYAALGVGAVAILSMLVILKREGLGPLAKQKSEQ